ncbi:MAG TPA: vanadium-dependent haloperoxidase [Casimicrobiaceae bacterium]|nr:vanadium-dependent haloperoxidase [Casimicrobiaceae bacterium]
MRTLLRALAGVVLLAVFHTPACADAVGDVHDLALKTSRAAGTPPGAQLDTLVIVDLAMFDAANAIERRYRPYRTHAAAAPAADGDAAAAAVAAGCAALVRWHPEQAAAATRACEDLLGALPRTASTADSIAMGADAGRAIVDARKAELRVVANAYRPKAAPGVYVATPLPIGFEVATMTPYVLSSPAQFRPGGPPTLASATWVRDFNEVKAMGARASAARSPAQTATAVYWSSAGPQQFLDSLPGVAIGMAKTPAEHARVLAVMTMAMADASIAVFDAKNAYDFWRPITAIRNGDLDGNDATAADATWAPLLETPLHQEYPCAHCAALAGLVAAVTVLGGETDLREPVVIRPAAGAGNVPLRSWAHVADVLSEVQDARVWGGMHYRSSTAAGVALGTAAGRWVAQTQLQPLAARP